jgi:hypothetical protein
MRWEHARVEHTVSRLHATGGPRTNRALAAMVPLYRPPSMTVPPRAAAAALDAQPAARGTLAATMSRASRNPGKVNAKNDRCRCLRFFERHVLSTIQLLDLARRPRRNSDAHTRCLAGERLRWQTRSRCLIPARHARLTDLASAPIGLVAADCDLREAQSAAAGFTLSCGTYECTIHHLNL